MVCSTSESELLLLISRELKCPVCTNVFINDPFSFSCGHTLCYSCMEESVERMGCCPLCRAKVHKRSSFRVPLLGDIAKLVKAEARKYRWEEMATQFEYTQR
ncbi:hypothetical protein XU18_4162 [Perkinsela sp. CCAP 1560/4]|nr:hypothetical protein XU18_4162 [Perkinsela sp. CCAP 1560/4]|eukprot:KNH04674.1 hypothetical protein XU18_4162 [Perkinsela sp. CCAP 1560/4]